MAPMTAFHALTQIGKQSDLEINLIDGALRLAQWSDPGLNIDPYRRHVEILVRDVRAFIGRDKNDGTLILKSVRQILAKRYGYAKSTTKLDRQTPMNMAQVIDCRRGEALTLCILYLHVLEKIGQRADIMDFPARPLVRVYGERTHTIVDPLNGGKPVDAHQLRNLFKDDPSSTSVSAHPFAIPILARRMVLVRLQDALKIHLLEKNAPEAAIATLEAALLVAPAKARLWREIGVLHARLDHVDESILALKNFLNFPADDTLRYGASQLLQRLENTKDC